MNELWRHRDAARQALAVVDLIAPPKVRSLGRRAVEAGEMLNVNVTSHRAEGVSDDFREGRTALSEAMREDLGLQATAEVAEKRNQRLSANQCPFPRHGPIAAAVVAELVDQVRRALARRALRAAQLAAARPGGASGRPGQPCQGPGWLTVGTAGLHVRTRPPHPPGACVGLSRWSPAGGVTWRDIACAAQARPGASDANRPLPAGLAGRWPARCPAVTGVRAHTLRARPQPVPRPRGGPTPRRRAGRGGDDPGRTAPAGGYASQPGAGRAAGPRKENRPAESTRARLGSPRPPSPAEGWPRPRGRTTGRGDP